MARCDLILGIFEPPLQRAAFGLGPERDAIHTTSWGASGNGKSRAAIIVASQTIRSGERSLVNIDPHDTPEHILAILAERGCFRQSGDPFASLVHLDWSHPVPFNVLAGPADPYTKASGVVSAFERVFPECASAPHFRVLMLSLCYTLAVNKLPLVPHLFSLLTDDSFRAWALNAVTDPMIGQTISSFEGRGGQLQQAGSSIRRVFMLSFSPILKYALSQPDNLVQHRGWADAGISVQHHLGHIRDTDARNLLAALLLVDLERAMLGRLDVPAPERRPVLVMVDEWVSLYGDQAVTMGVLLEQLRKAGVAMWLSGQSTGQVGSNRLAAALENARCTIAFGCGHATAVDLSRVLGPLDPYLLPSPGGWYKTAVDELQNLPPRLCYVRVAGWPAVKIRCLDVPDAQVPPAEMEQILAAYRARYNRSPQEAERRSRALCPRPAAVDIPEEAAEEQIVTFPMQPAAPVRIRRSVPREEQVVS